jgi:D-sedoheptulose 7-phosphate isomerase
VQKRPKIQLVQLHNDVIDRESCHGGARRSLRHRQDAFASALERLCLDASCLDAAADIVIDALQGGGRVLAAGNGGSAAEAQHLAAELVGRFLRERSAYAAVALTADTATLTAVANDYGYEEVFARQVMAHGRPGDALVAFSTSGESRNLLRAVEAARCAGLSVVAITGGRPNRLAAAADVAIRAPAIETPLIQELHTIVLHVVCDMVETAMAASELKAAAK